MKAAKTSVVKVGGRKDRHSKVCTPRGTRERRVRLSPKTAILFYDVQDRLGYDRPSKAIDWLIKEAKPAIDALAPPPTTAAADQSNTKIEHDCNIPWASAGFGFFKSEEQFLPAPPNSEANAGEGEEDYSNFHMREPLQSSNWSQFQGFRSFPIDQELPGHFSGDIPVFSMSSYATSLLHYEE